MSCPDWRRLAASGDDFLREGSAERRRALAHAATCPRCESAALRLDPSLAAGRSTPPPATRSEIDQIKRNVEGLRRLREVDAVARPRSRARARMAAVAVLTAGILLVAEDTDDRGDVETTAAATAVVAPTALLSEDYRLYGSLPLVESLEPSEARVYQLGRDDFSLVWIVDESIEVVAPSR